jgi:kalirin
MNDSSHCIIVQTVYTTISHLMTVAQRLCDSGHYAAPSIRLQANKLDRDWQTFAAAIEERSTILALSVVFHKKASEVNGTNYLA